jgi:hypothetical protein
MGTPAFETTKAMLGLLSDRDGASPGAGRLLTTLVKRGLDQAALMPAAALVAELDHRARRNGDLTGETFGRLLVLGPSERRGNRTYWAVRCACGREKWIRGDSMKNGNSSSCGSCRPSRSGSLAA